MTFKPAVVVGAIVIIGVAVVGVTVIDDTGDRASSGRSASAKESFCSVMTQTNGSRLVELVRTGELGGRESWSWIVDGVTDMGTPAIRPDMTTLREGIKAQPANPSAATLAAAARVDAYVLKTCSS